jgi:hypothetical protein
MPRGKERKRVLARLGEDMARIEKALGLWTPLYAGAIYTSNRARARDKKRNEAASRRRKEVTLAGSHDDGALSSGLVTIKMPVTPKRIAAIK